MDNTADMVIRIDTVDQLFNAPSIDPFSDTPASILGEPALMYAVREQLGRGLRAWRVSRMVIQLPANQVTPGLEEKVIGAIRRYAAYKYAENQILIRNTRTRSLIRLAIAIALVLVILAIASVAANSLLASTSSNIATLLVSFLTIIIWATVWGPWDMFIYGWLDPGYENFILRRIKTMEIVLQPEPQNDRREESHPRVPDSEEMPRSREIS